MSRVVSQLAGRGLSAFKAARGAGGVAAETLAGVPMGAPGGASMMAAGGLMLGEAVADPFRDMFHTDQEDPLVAQAKIEQKRVLGAMGARQRLAELERKIAENLARVAAVRPDAYATVAAGRRLPRGARVHGGRIREDLLEILGRAMAAQDEQGVANVL